MNYNILIVEDEIFSSQYLINILKKLNYKNIFEATNHDEALDIIQSNHIDLIFMDINIDGVIDGITSAHILNEKYFLPIIYTSAYGDSSTISDASDTNIFGYLVKPFEVSDVEAALRVAFKLIKKHNPIHNPTKLENKYTVIELADNQTYDTEKRTYFIEGIPVILTKNEISILDIFAHNINRNITYEELNESIWNNTEVSLSTIRDAISRFRKKAPLINIKNIVGYGYILEK